MTHTVAAYSCMKNKYSFNEWYLCYIFLHMNMCYVHVCYQTTFNAVQDYGFQGLVGYTVFRLYYMAGMSLFAILVFASFNC